MWNYHKPEEGRWYCWHLNGAAAYLRKEGNAWQTAFAPISPDAMGERFGGPEEALAPESLPGTLSLGLGDQVILRPSLSPKPYLATLENKTLLFPETEIALDVFFPPLLQFELSPVLILAGFMPFTLRETWFGADAGSGILCLALPAFLVRRGKEAPESWGALIRGGLILRNRSKDPVDISRFIIYTETLAVYEEENRLYSDEMTMEFLAGGDLRINDRAPDRRMNRIRPDKYSARDVLIRRGADFIKKITGI
jgi:hypothetical protein